MKAKRTMLTRYTRPFLFSLVCALIALVYCGWRAYVFLGPNGVSGFVASLQQPTHGSSCFEEGMGEDIPPQNQPTFISSDYQQFIEKQAAQSANLLTNVSLERVNPESGQPIGYYWLSANDATAYSYERERGITMPYLRVKTTKPSAGEPAGGWITDAVRIKPHATYAYSFNYRISTPVAVSLEYGMAGGSKTYESITNLPASTEWQRFTHYMHNIREAESFRFVLTAHEAGQVDTRDYSIYQINDAALKQGIVSITFDDGWQSIADNAIPLLDQYDLRSTQYIIGEAVERAVPGYMQSDTLKKLHAEGHEIGSHSLSHCDQTQLANTEILANVTQSKTILEQAGLTPVHSFAFPYGKYDDNVQPLIARAFPLLRSSDTGYNDRYFDKRNIRTMAISATTSSQTFASWLEHAKKHRLWLVLTYHQVGAEGPYNVSEEQFKHHLELIKDSGLKVLPVSEAADAVHQQ